MTRAYGLPFWTVFGSIWLAVGAPFLGFAVYSLWTGREPVSETALFLGLGLLVGGGGAAILVVDGRRRRRAHRLRTAGVRTLATVVDVTPLRVFVNRQQLWRIRYEYKDFEHRTHRSAEYTTAEEATRWSPGQTVPILIDPAEPGSSLWTAGAQESPA
jgi:hypothetical protein